MARTRSTKEGETGSKPLPAITDIYSIPDIYDILHAPGTVREVGMCLRTARRYAGEGARAAKTWLEPACGTGRYVRALARRGCSAVGVDLSGAMIAYARDRAKKSDRARFEVGDITRIDRIAGRGKFDAAINLINSIRHLMTDRQMDEHLSATGAALKSGGVYIVGLSVTLYGQESPTEDVWKGSRGRMKVLQVIQYEPPIAKRGLAARTERAYSFITASSPSRSREFVSSYALRCYSREQWMEAIGRSPLRLVAVINESGREIDVPTLGYGIYVLKNPGS